MGNIFLRLSLFLFFIIFCDYLIIGDLYAANGEFIHLKSVLSSEKTTKEIMQKKIKVYQSKQQDMLVKQNKFMFPHSSDFWNFISKYWLVKNRGILNWNLDTPNYSLVPYLLKFLKAHGFIDTEIKLLIVDSPIVFYMVLPSTSNNFIFLLSNKFIKDLDLTKNQIAILLLQEILRNLEKIPFKYLKYNLLRKKFGTNLFAKRFPKKEINRLLDDISNMYFNKGFSFKDQFLVTKSTEVRLSLNQNERKAYIKLLHKINNIIKTNVYYKRYTKIFPSPELQLNWLRKEIRQK